MASKGIFGRRSMAPSRRGAGVPPEKEGPTGRDGNHRPEGAVFCIFFPYATMNGGPGSSNLMCFFLRTGY